LASNTLKVKIRQHGGTATSASPSPGSQRSTLSSKWHTMSISKMHIINEQQDNVILVSKAKEDKQ
jgi:hypothetical protein